ncbi:tRNA (guanine(26)-N(2))-dimethyltransferase [Penicillium diatomitis]|uniref:tRNA (guanine(26)-N(2))-dimethyltransferase n=1 Tax=Penicillium diatomitis TaxID=2819901 RepID=A0A9X0BJF9_9EURO|nr:tRNA (guanine(26)-N(2))-dimethyltransferase [Penicillium diatomitis]KAJ5469419.1 tRNA (guanine(26)-N(2))-dimethyltransferase [Penicillium diatomitis]
MEISPEPATSKLVQHGGVEYNVIKEGLAHILNPAAQEAASKGTRRDLSDKDESQSVFYNPIQQFNRDLSVLAIRAYSEHVADVRRQKADQKSKRRSAGNGTTAQGTKRKREDSPNEKSEKSARADVPEETAVTDASLTESATTKPETATTTTTTTTTTSPPSSSQFTVLDALSATGLRALRYASELPVVTKVVGNDLSESAIKSMKTNIAYNKLEDRIQPNLGDARAYMYRASGDPSRKFDVIDLDPYGTAAPFIDAALQAVKDGGLLCVTCTDAGVWASTGYAEKAFSLYGGNPVKGLHSHEAGLRLILNSLAMSAAKYGIAIEPLLSLSIDFYARVFVRVTRSPAQVKFLASNSMIVYNCDSGCGAWSIQPLAASREKLDRNGNPVYHFKLAQGPTANTFCEHCGLKTHLAGPMWAGPLHNPHFIQRILDTLPKLDPEVYQTIPRIEGMLTTAMEEDLDLSPTLTKPSAQQQNQNQNQAQPQQTKESSNPENSTQSEPHQNEYPAIIPRINPALHEPYPFYFSLSALSKVLHCSTVPQDEFRGALRSVGYRSTRSHAKPNSIRTDAPWAVIWEIMREWVRQHSPVKESSLKPGTAGAVIMAKSRENLRKGPIAQPNPSGEDRQDPWLAQLKNDLLAAVQSGRDITDLVTKVEASLYRSGPRQSLVSPPQQQQQQDSPEKDQPVPTTQPTSQPQPSSHPSTLNVKFDAALGREASAAHSKKRLVRYQINPRANWGPLNRAAIKLRSGGADESASAGTSG